MKNGGQIYLILLIFTYTNLLYYQNTLPNIVIIVADDLGCGDLGSFNNKVIKTKNLDKLVAESIMMLCKKLHL